MAEMVAGPLLMELVTPTGFVIRSRKRCPAGKAAVQIARGLMVDRDTCYDGRAIRG